MASGFLKYEAPKIEAFLTFAQVLAHSPKIFGNFPEPLSSPVVYRRSSTFRLCLAQRKNDGFLIWGARRIGLLA